jgi:hypothetical protein|tara:strand:- start:360 stop:644 length:285 start_codon:yes stop_codon:yes gene_type:complete
MLARAVIMPGVVLPMTLLVRRIVLAVGMSIVSIGQLFVRIAERDPFKRFRGIFGTFSLTERDVMRWWIVEDKVSRTRRCRKPFGGAKPNYVRSV